MSQWMTWVESLKHLTHLGAHSTEVSLNFATGISQSTLKVHSPLHGCIW